MKVLALVRAAAVLASILVNIGCGSEREGVAKYDDCREIIPLSKADFEREKLMGKDFTCSHKATGSECVSITLSGPSCAVALVYAIPAEPRNGTQVPCNDPHEIRSESGNCWCGPGYRSDPQTTRCVPTGQ